jgi:hypothetical protein
MFAGSIRYKQESMNLKPDFTTFILNPECDRILHAILNSYEFCAGVSVL